MAHNVLSLNVGEVLWEDGDGVDIGSEEVEEAKLRFNLCATESFQLIKLIDFRVKIHRNGHRGTAKYHLIIRLDLCEMDIDRDKKGPY